MVPVDAADVVTSVVDSISEESGMLGDIDDVAGNFTVGATGDVISLVVKSGIVVLGLIAVNDEFIPFVIVVETSFVVLTCDVAFIVEFPNSVVSTDNKVMVVSDDVVS